MTSGIQFSGKGGVFGFVADQVLNTFPLGTIVGALSKNLTNLNAGDLSAAYDKHFSEAKSQFQSGDYAGMARGLFDKFEAWVGGGVNQSGQPTTNEAALALARPRVDGDAQRDAQAKSGFGGWGKTLLIGGGILAGLSLLRNFTMGGFGMPFYGGGMTNMSMLDPGSLMLMMQQGLGNPMGMGMDPTLMAGGFGGGGGLSSLLLLGGGAWLVSKLLKGVQV